MARKSRWKLRDKPPEEPDTRTAKEVLRDAAERLQAEQERMRQLAVTPREELFRFLQRVAPEQLRQMEQNIQEARKAAVLRGQELRRSAVFATGQVWAMLEDLGEDTPGLQHFTLIDAARWVLEQEEEQERDTLAAELRAEEPQHWQEGTPLGRFLAALREHVGLLREHVGLGDGAELPTTEDEATRQADTPGDPLLWLDERFAVYLEGVSETMGRTMAADVRERAQKRWHLHHQQTTMEVEPENGRLLALWIDLEAEPEDRFTFLLRLAHVVWRDVVRPELEEERERAARRAPGLSLELFGRTAGRYRKDPDLSVTDDGFKITDDDGQIIHLADLPAEVPLKLLEGAPRALGTIHAYDTAIWAITQGARETWAKQGSPGRWRFYGGKHIAALVQGLETIEAPNPDARRNIKATVAKQYEQAAIAQLVPFRNPRNSAEVLSLAGGRVRAGRGRRPTIIELDLAGWALPGDVYDRMGGGHNARARELRKIVPLPTGRPKLLGDPYRMTEGPAAWLFARVVGAIRLRAADVARGDGAHLPIRILAQLAEEAGLDLRWIQQHLDLWLDAEEGPPDLEQFGRDRYHVGGAHRTARLSVEREGKKEADGKRGKPPRRKCKRKRK